MDLTVRTMYGARVVVAAIAALGVSMTGLMPTAQAAAVAPTHVTVDGQTGGASVSESPVIAWDRVDGAAFYNVKVTANPDGSGATFASVSGTVNSHYVPTAQLPIDTTLYAEVQANGGAWSYGVDFIRATVDPPSGLHTVNADGAQLDSYQAPNAPVFTWNAVPGATSYSVEVSSTGDFADASHYTTYNSSGTRLALAQLQQPEIDTNTGEPQPWTWRVMATLATGITTAYSAPRAYVIEPLDRPQRVSPTQGDTVDGKSTDLALDWTAVLGAATYDLQWSTDWQFKNGVSEADGLVSTRYTPSTTWTNTTWYWRVKGVDADGNSEPWWNIATQTDPALWSFTRKWSAQPTLQYPLMDATVTGSGDSPLLFQWSGVRLASNYTLQYRPWKTDGTDSLAANWDGNPAVKTCSTTLTTLTPSASPTFCNGFAAGTTYAWRVLATDAPAGIKSEDTAAPAGRFTYQPVVRNPGLAQPSAASGYQVAQNGTDFFHADADPGTADTLRCASKTCTNLRQTPVLRWDDDPSVAMWRIYIAKDSALTNLVPGYSTTNPVTVTQPYYAPTVQFADTQAGETGYWWKVVPCASATNCADKDAASYSFTKLSEAPQANPAQTTTTNGQLIACPISGGIQTCADDVTLSWNDYLDTESTGPDSFGTGSTAALGTLAAVEPRQYQIQWASDPSFKNDAATATIDGTSYTRSAATFPEGTVYWRVQPIDPNGNLLAPSPAKSFVKDSPMPEPMISTGWSGSLSWSALNFAKSYDVAVYPEVDGVTAGTNTAMVSTSTEQTTFTPGRMPTGRYVWHVRRADASNRKGAWSEWVHVQVSGVPVALDNPSDRSANLPPSDDVLTWEAADSATAYRVTLAHGATTIQSPITVATGWAPTTQLAGGTWSWSVAALDGTTSNADPVGTSIPRTFTVADHPTPLASPQILGSPQVGSQLTAVAGGWSLDDVAESFQWYRDDIAIRDATLSTYTLGTADFGHTVTVGVTGTKQGYASGNAQSAPVSVTAGDALFAISAPTISGAPQVGQLLSLGGGTWISGAKLTYQWLRDGTPIAGATGSTRRLAIDDAGRSISAIVTAKLTGYADGTATTASVVIDRVATTATSALGVKSIRKSKRAKITVTVKASGVVTSPGGVVRIYDKSRVLATKAVPASAHGVVTIKLPKLKRGKHKLVAKYLGDSITAPSQAKKLKLVVKG